MSEQGRLVSIFICADKALPMEAHDSATAIEGIGIEGDRYAVGAGAWSGVKRDGKDVIRLVTLFSAEVIGEVNTLRRAKGEAEFQPEDTRRNLLVAGVNLNGLVGQEFSVGDVRMRGAELAEPCARPSKLSGKPGFQEAFQNGGGIRAEILSTGTLSAGDPIVVLQEGYLR